MKQSAIETAPPASVGIMNNRYQLCSASHPAIQFIIRLFSPESLTVEGLSQAKAFTVIRYRNQSLTTYFDALNRQIKQRHPAGSLESQLADYVADIAFYIERSHPDPHTPIRAFLLSEANLHRAPACYRNLSIAISKTLMLIERIQDERFEL